MHQTRKILRVRLSQRLSKRNNYCSRESDINTLQLIAIIAVLYLEEISTSLFLNKTSLLIFKDVGVNFVLKFFSRYCSITLADVHQFTGGSSFSFGQRPFAPSIVLESDRPLCPLRVTSNNFKQTNNN